MDNKEELIHLIMDTMKEMKNTQIEAGQCHEVKKGEMMLLIRLKEYSEKLKQPQVKTTELSKILKLAPSTITPMINSLEDKRMLKKNF